MSSSIRDLATLPKAHLHLHFTGSMRPSTLQELAQEQGVRLPSHLLDTEPLRVPANKRGWFRFQRAYDSARALVRSEAIMRRIVDEAAIDDAKEGSRRLELQIDPTSYACAVGGITPALEIVLDQAKQSSKRLGIQVAVIVAASRIRHPLDARVLARLAVRHSGTGPGEVVAFGLSNDERAGRTSDFAPAFRIARQAGLPAVPHGGELLGPDHLQIVLDQLRPARLGHGVRLAEDPALLGQVISADIALELCPTSNVCLGVYPQVTNVPIAQLRQWGAKIALGADDPLLFHSRLVDQYQLVRTHFGFSDAQIAALARESVSSSLADEVAKKCWLAEIDAWLAGPPTAVGPDK